MLTKHFVCLGFLFFLFFLGEICDSINLLSTWMQSPLLLTTPVYILLSRAMNQTQLLHNFILHLRSFTVVPLILWTVDKMKPHHHHHHHSFTKKFILRQSLPDIKIKHNLISYSNDSIRRVCIYHPIQEWGYKQCHSLSGPDAAIVD